MKFHSAVVQVESIENYFRGVNVMGKIFIIVVLLITSCAFAENEPDQKPRLVDQYEVDYNHATNITKIVIKNAGNDSPAIPDFHNLKFSVLIEFSGKYYDPNPAQISILSEGKPKKFSIKFSFSRRDVGVYSVWHPDGGKFLWDSCHPITLQVDNKKFGFKQRDVDYFHALPNEDVYECMIIPANMKLLKLVASGATIKGNICNEDFKFSKNQEDLAKASLYLLDNMKR